MNQPNETLTERLTRAGLILAADTGEQEPESPWFIKALLALAGWVASIFILGFIGVGFIALIENSVASILVGTVMIGGAYLLLRIPKNDFVEHMALALSLAGQLLIAWGIGSALDWKGAAPFCWSLVILQGSLALIMPNYVHRVFSTFAATLAFSLAMREIGAGPVSGGLVLLLITWIWLNEFRYPDRLRLVQALGYGLVLGLLVIQYLLRFNMMNWHGDLVVWARPWMGELFAGLAVLYLVWRLFARASAPAPQSVQVAIYASVLVLFFASLQAYGLTQGMVVLLLGFALSNRILMGLGATLLLFSISSYYYLLDATLLTKAQTLLALGFVLLATRWLMLHLAPERKESNHG